MKIEFRKAHDNSWIECFECGQRSHNPQDASRLYCGSCHKWHTRGITEPPPNAGSDRQTKIIVALFLVLGKAVAQLNEGQRSKLCVTETEIKTAWTTQKSPVRLISEVRHDNYIPELGEIYQPSTDRVYSVVLGELDMKKTGLDLNKPVPEEKIATSKKTRVFDLE